MELHKKLYSHGINFFMDYFILLKKYFKILYKYFKFYLFFTIFIEFIFYYKSLFKDKFR